MDPRYFWYHGTALYFSSGPQNSTSAYLYKADIDNTGGVSITEEDLLPGTAAYHFTMLNNELYYVSNSSGSNIYKVDSDPSIATSVVSNLDPYYQTLYTANGKLYYAGTDSTHGTELWEYDSTTNTSTLVSDINPGTGSSNPLHVMELNGDIVFEASPDGTYNYLYNWDGTTLTQLN
jgi:ELWxxDGT repeat protein